MDMYLNISGIITSDSCWASIVDCQVLVEFGITKPNSKFHSTITTIIRGGGIVIVLGYLSREAIPASFR